MELPQVLSPAGDEECLRAALLYGADAVYLAGRSFGMRAAASNFDEDGLRRAAALAHAQGKRVYAACNTLPRDGELAALPGYLELLQDAGVDAVIAADLGVMALAKRYAPRCALHVSTQLGVVNHETARVLYEMGASRVVLARELSLEEIAELRAKTPPALELEAFVHGAMCLSYSGRCVLSNYLTGRDSNRGACAQPCRWGYRLVEPGRPDRPMDLLEEAGETYLLNAEDLCMLEHIPALAAAGVSSLKIEGRAKAAYYVAVITNAYRQAADGWREAGYPPDYRPPAWLLEEPDKVSHRPYGTGFYFGQPSQNTRFGGYIRRYEVAAVVEGWREGRLLLRQRNRFAVGDRLEALEPGLPPFEVPVTALWDGEGAPIGAAPHPTMAVSIPFDRPLTPGSLLRRRCGAPE